MEAPRDNLVRGALPFELRAAGETGEVLLTRFAVFDTWTEIHSWFEGDFLERLAPGSFRKTIRESGEQVKVLYDHGMDFHVGNKVLGVPEVLREESEGPWAEVPLLDTSYNRDLIPGLRAGAYGASFRFRVVKEEWDDEPDVSDHNPAGMPERTIKEVRLFEFGPVTFPAYPEATAGLRSLTDAWLERVAERYPDRFASVLDANPGAAARYQDLRTRATGSRPAALPDPMPEPQQHEQDGTQEPSTRTEESRDDEPDEGSALSEEEPQQEGREEPHEHSTATEPGQRAQALRRQLLMEKGVL